MTKLNIVLSSNSVETVTPQIINQLYNAALSVPTPEEGETDLAYVSGHISVDHVYEDIVKYLAGTIGEGTSGVVTSILQNAQGRFLDLRIDATNGLYISFADSNVKSICETTWGNGSGVTTSTLAAVTALNNAFNGNTNIVNFDEFKYFTGLNYLNNNSLSGLFAGCINLTSITIPSTLTKIDRSMFDSCSRLSTINLQNVTFIGPEGFRDCDFSGFDLNAPNLTNVGYSCFKNTNIKTVSNLGTLLFLEENMFSNCKKLESIILPPSCTTIKNAAIRSVDVLNSINVEDVVNIGWSNFGWCYNLPEIMWFKSLRTLLYQNANNCGHLTLLPTKYLYLPSLESTCSGFDTGGNNVAGLFIESGWGVTRSSFNVVYFKNLTSIQTGCFCGSIISKLVINNTTPPTVTQSLRSLTVDTLIGSTNTSGTDIVNIYVPDSAVNTYKDSTNHPYWAALSSRIHPISDLNQVADEETFNALSESDKLNTLITAYM